MTTSDEFMAANWPYRMRDHGEVVGLIASAIHECGDGCHPTCRSETRQRAIRLIERLEKNRYRIYLESLGFTVSAGPA